MTDHSGPAFPLPAHGDPGRDSVWNPPEYGMTLRDWFAGNLMPGLMAELYQQCRETNKEVENIYVTSAKAAYEAADAMLAERAK